MKAHAKEVRGLITYSLKYFWVSPYYLTRLDNYECRSYHFTHYEKYVTRSLGTQVQQLRRNLKYGENAANAPMSPQPQQAEGKKKKKGIIEQVVRLGRYFIPGSSSKKRRNDDEAVTSHSK